MQAVVAWVNRVVVRPDGQDLIEYALLVALIAIVAIVGVGFAGTVVRDVLWTPIAAAF
jgi:Flp pilus assembly pilin Flp